MKQAGTLRVQWSLTEEAVRDSLVDRQDVEVARQLPLLGIEPRAELRASMVAGVVWMLVQVIGRESRISFEHSELRRLRPGELGRRTAVRPVHRRSANGSRPTANKGGCPLAPRPRGDVSKTVGQSEAGEWRGAGE